MPQSKGKKLTVILEPTLHNAVAKKLIDAGESFQGMTVRLYKQWMQGEGEQSTEAEVKKTRSHLRSELKDDYISATEGQKEWLERLKFILEGRYPVAIDAIKRNLVAFEALVKAVGPHAEARSHKPKGKASSGGSRATPIRPGGSEEND